MIIAVDTGNKQVKTEHFNFISGVSQYSVIPTTVVSGDYMKYRGKYYVLSSQREEYLRDKSKSERYFILSLLGIVKELDYQCDQGSHSYEKDRVYSITLLCGLPPAHMEDGSLRKNFKSYFRMKEPEKVTFKGRVWNIRVSKVEVYAQCYAAIMTIYPKIKDYPRVLGIDIGGFTADYMMLKLGHIDIENTDSMENGVILLYRYIKRECAKKYDAIIEESDVDEILQGHVEMYENEIVGTVRRCAENFVEKLLASFRELQIDLKNCYVVFMGGGSLILQEFIEKSPLLKKYMLLDEINVNVMGYKFLYRVSQRRKSGR